MLSCFFQRSHAPGDPLQIEGTVALVTGASRGIGKAGTPLSAGLDTARAELDVNDFGLLAMNAWNFTNSARIELKRQDTHVVGVHVGYVDMTRRAT